MEYEQNHEEWIGFGKFTEMEEKWSQYREQRYGKVKVSVPCLGP